MKLSFASAAAVTALAFGVVGARADNLETLEGMHVTAPIGVADRSAGRPKSGRRQANPQGQGQTAARLPH
jgi:hypothetical protein